MQNALLSAATSALVVLVMLAIEGRLLASVENEPAADRSTPGTALAPVGPGKLTGPAPGDATPPLDPTSKQVSNAKATSGVSEKVLVLTENLTRLLRRVERLEHELAHGEWTPLDAAPTLIPEEVAEEEEAELHQQEFGFRREDDLAQQFASETIDADWRTDMEDKIQASVAKMPAMGLNETQMVFHECRGTLCAAEFVHGAQEDPRFLSLALAIPGITQVTVIPEPPRADGEQVSTVYLYREGFGPQHTPD